MHAFYLYVSVRRVPRPVTSVSASATSTTYRPTAAPVCPAIGAPAPAGPMMNHPQIFYFP